MDNNNNGNVAAAWELDIGIFEVLIGYCWSYTTITMNKSGWIYLLRAVSRSTPHSSLKGNLSRIPSREKSSCRILE